MSPRVGLFRELGEGLLLLDAMFFAFLLSRVHHLDAPFLKPTLGGWVIRGGGPVLAWFVLPDLADVRTA